MTQKNFIELELSTSKTTISIQRGTKKILDDLGMRNESYDDIIRRILKEKNKLEEELQNLSKNQPQLLNKIRIKNLEIKEGTYAGEEYKIFYQYNLPQKPLNEFHFNIIIKKIIKGRKEIKIKNLDEKEKKELAKTYLKLYAKLIKTYIDKLFRLQERQLFNLEWWKRKLLSTGLVEETYKKDIEEKLLELGVKP